MCQCYFLTIPLETNYFIKYWTDLHEIFWICTNTGGVA